MGEGKNLKSLNFKHFITVGVQELIYKKYLNN